MRPTLQLFVPNLERLQIITSTARASNMFSDGFHQFLNKAESALLGGVGCIQYRPTGTDLRVIINHISALKKLCADHQVRLLINTPYPNQNMDLAKSTDGMWIDGSPEINSIMHARKYLGNEAFLGASCNSLNDVEQINGLHPDTRLDGISLGNIFGSTTLCSRDINRGISEVRQFKDLTPHNVPLLVGGVGRNVKPVMLAGADAVVVSDDLLLALDPQAQAEKLAIDTLQFAGIIICIDEHLPI